MGAEVRSWWCWSRVGTQCVTLTIRGVSADATWRGSRVDEAPNFRVRYVCADQERWVEIAKDAEKKDDRHTSCAHRDMNMNRPCAIESSDAELTQRLVAYSFCPQLGWPHVSQFGQRFNSSVPCNECRVVPCLGFERHDLESKSRLSMAQNWTGG